MTDNVVKFPKPDQIIYKCHCGCTSFFIHLDGKIECCNCLTDHANHDATPGEWVKQLPPEPDVIEKTDAGAIKSSALGNVDFARSSVLRTVQDWAKDGVLQILIGYQEDGRGKHWLNIANQQEKEWCVRRITELLEHLKQTEIIDDD